uniref:Secreted protein n=1 Tax=Syphacia muris TaxID=451379 RepID=A0A0N5AG86_9BILA
MDGWMDVSLLTLRVLMTFFDSDDDRSLKTTETTTPTQYLPTAATARALATARDRAPATATAGYLWLFSIDQ